MKTLFDAISAITQAQVDGVTVMNPGQWSLDAMRFPEAFVNTEHCPIVRIASTGPHPLCAVGCPQAHEAAVIQGEGDGAGFILACEGSMTHH
ncbi:hypothetical protein [Brevifollis gellanilyticus]|uniref:Uncharacterized protein n=1 Tax=Brevifollis gellanilyticus TaxID=748831 RepID=A0A512MC29_9BACT|nr:hypothetical protein [Brevifollis gellanilyticus]GEP44285.1 hypothetical protein BGE01nite_35760 [Brevifollis gellanilyticus]